MKIMFGQFQKIDVVIGKNNKLRPTTAFIKKIIFNTLKLEGSEKILDLFAGTGLLGIESLSIGVSSVTFVDISTSSIKTISETLKKLKKIDPDLNFIVKRMDFRSFLINCNEKFDVIFVDPPFIVEKYYKIILSTIIKKKMLMKTGVIVLEKPKKINLNLEEKFVIKKYVKNGDKELFFLSINTYNYE